MRERIGIIICDRYRMCAGGKCLRSFRNREGAFSIYRGRDVELAGYATCGGCPGGNVEYAPEEMKKNGVQVVHFATGLIVGYPPCPYIRHFRDFVVARYEMKVVMGTHPIPQKYYDVHVRLKTWDSPEWREIIQPTLIDQKTRISYD
jgi:predicted metal-binding protein